MATITVRIPDEKYERLKQLARHQGVSINKLIDELSTTALAEFDVETRFLVRAGRGNAERGLKLLDKLDRANT